MSHDVPSGAPTGRKSGAARSVTLNYFPDGSAFVVIASNAAKRRIPAVLLEPTA
jgi:hypothetical protein